MARKPTTTEADVYALAAAAENAVPAEYWTPKAESVVVYYSRSGDRVASEVWVGDQTSVATIGTEVTIAHHGHARHNAAIAIRNAGAYRFETFRLRYGGGFRFEFGERI